MVDKTEVDELMKFYVELGRVFERTAVLDYLDMQCSESVHQVMLEIKAGKHLEEEENGKD